MLYSLLYCFSIMVTISVMRPTSAYTVTVYAADARSILILLGFLGLAQGKVKAAIYPPPYHKLVSLTVREM